MKITWLGHAAFKLESDSLDIVFDPYKDGYVPGLSDIRETADIVLMSHTQHDDHNGIEHISLSGRYSVSESDSGITVIAKANGNPFPEVSIFRIDTFHDHHQGANRGPNSVYIVEVDGFKLAHMGDIGFVADLEKDEAFKMLLDLDLLILPVGGFYTIDAAEAVEYLKLLKPRMVIPMHFRSDEDGYGYDAIASVDDFVAELERSGLADSMLNESATDFSAGNASSTDFSAGNAVYRIENALSSAVELEKSPNGNSYRATILTPRQLI